MWDYPPLKQVLEGNITSLGAWSGEAPYCADDLAVIRLQILARQERFEEYLYLATATKAKVKAFQALPSFADYRQVEKLAEENWSNIKEELLTSLATSTSWGVEKAKVDIYLYKGFIDQAITCIRLYKLLYLPLLAD